MMDVWKEHGPPPFISLAVANGHKRKDKKGSTDEKKTGTVAELAALLGMGGKRSKAAF